MHFVKKKRCCVWFCSLLHPQCPKHVSFSCCSWCLAGEDIENLCLGDPRPRGTKLPSSLLLPSLSLPLPSLPPLLLPSLSSLGNRHKGRSIFLGLVIIKTISVTTQIRHNFPFFQSQITTKMNFFKICFKKPAETSCHYATTDNLLRHQNSPFPSPNHARNPIQSAHLRKTSEESKY